MWFASCPVNTDILACIAVSFGHHQHFRSDPGKAGKPNKYNGFPTFCFRCVPEKAVAFRGQQGARFGASRPHVFGVAGSRTGAWRSSEGTLRSGSGIGAARLVKPSGAAFVPRPRAADRYLHRPALCATARSRPAFRTGRAYRRNCLGSWHDGGHAKCCGFRADWRRAARSLAEVGGRLTKGTETVLMTTHR